MQPPNERPPVVAGTALLFAIASHWPGTTEAERSASPTHYEMLALRDGGEGGLRFLWSWHLRHTQEDEGTLCWIRQEDACEYLRYQEDAQRHSRARCVLVRRVRG